MTWGGRAGRWIKPGKRGPKGNNKPDFVTTTAPARGLTDRQRMRKTTGWGVGGEAKRMSPGRPTAQGAGDSGNASEGTAELKQRVRGLHGHLAGKCVSRSDKQTTRRLVSLVVTDLPTGTLTESRRTRHNGRDALPWKPAGHAATARGCARRGSPLGPGTSPRAGRGRTRRSGSHVCPR